MSEQEELLLVLWKAKLECKNLYMNACIISNKAYEECVKANNLYAEALALDKLENT